MYFKNEEKINLRGQVEALVNDDYKFKTENITILRNEMIINSDVGATILDNINKTRYEIGKFSYSLTEEILKVKNFLLIQSMISLLMTSFFLKVQSLI